MTRYRIKVGALAVVVGTSMAMGVGRVHAEGAASPTPMPGLDDPTDATGALIIEKEPLPTGGGEHPVDVDDPRALGNPRDVGDSPAGVDEAPAVPDPVDVEDTHGAVDESTGGARAAADNTARNVRDRAGYTLTPMDQSEAPGDLGTTQRIRKALVANEELSMNAKNVKIITTDGVVTLRGPVQTPAEKNTVARLARTLAGRMAVQDELEVIHPEKGEH
jgi:hypothetical protein